MPKFPRATLVPTMPPSMGGSAGAGDSSSSSLAAAAGASSTAADGGGQGMSAVERGQEGERFLKALKGVWDDHISCMGKVRDVLKYMVCPPARPRDRPICSRAPR